MATMVTTASIVTPTASSKSNLLLNQQPLGVPPVLVLPTVSVKGRVKCMAEEKSTGKSASHLSSVCTTAAAVAVITVSGPATALVDERMSTEGMGLPFGISNNLLVWIILGVFGLIWAFYVTYAFSLDEDDESGLSL